MQKQAPSIARIVIAVGFALSCFGLLLFLWVSFGGPTPFKAKSYEFTADFEEAVTLAKESDVRIGGVTVGSVSSLSLPEEGNATEVKVEMDPKFAPIPSDSRAILRQKTLLGETFIELTGGSSDAPKLADGGHLDATNTVESTQIDEIFNALDGPTRKAFRIWMQNSAIAVKDRGLDLNDAFGNLGPFTSDATDILAILRHQDRALQGLVRDTGAVFESLSARDQELAGAIVNSNTTFGAIASRDRALAEVIHIFPTFNEQTRLTLNRLAEFATDTEPLVRDLKPVASDLTPTFQKVRAFSPHLRGLFIRLKPLIRASQSGLPGLRRTLRELRPVLAALDPFLSNLNPVIRYINAYKANVGDWMSSPPAALSGTVDPAFAQEPGNPAPHTLRQLSYLSTETLSVFPERLATNRGNGYLQPLALTSPQSAMGGIFPNFDCDNTGEGEISANEATPDKAACFVAPNFPSEFGGERAPQVFADP
jgi:phospholipid/cholesterol/gamma-HCH transport system substrate-binding protein